MVRKGIEKRMREKDTGALAHSILYALSLVYGSAVRLRLFLYKAGILKSRNLPCRVISIGNITAGGTGKTPMAIHIAGILREAGKRVVVLSRGYRGKARGVSVVSDGDKILLGAREAGDEPYLMARRLKDTPVIVCPDRVRAGLYAVEKFSPDFIILDDGFQHIRIKRDLNIILIDSEEGFGNGYLLPRGVLREPLDGIKRADICMIKGGDLKKSDTALIAGFGIPALKFSYRAASLLNVNDNKDASLQCLKGKKAAVLAGVANPESFFKTLDGLNVRVVKKFIYPDHHRYSASDMEDIKEEIKSPSSGADVIITTEKDAVKLKDIAGLAGVPVYALIIDVAIEDKAGFSKLLAPLL